MRAVRDTKLQKIDHFERDYKICMLKIFKTDKEWNSKRK
jgi:hypothetical protein